MRSENMGKKNEREEFSDNENGPTAETTSRETSKDLKKKSHVTLEKVKPKDDGREPRNRTAHTDALAKVDSAAETKDTNKQTVNDSSKQEQWLDYLTTFMCTLLTVSAIIAIYHFLFIRSLSFISEEKSIIESCIEKKYLDAFEKMLKEKGNTIESSILKNLELNINTIKENLRSLETDIGTATKNQHDEVHGLKDNVKNTKKRIGHLHKNLLEVKKVINKVQAAAMDTLNKKAYQLEKSTEDLNISLKALSTEVAAVSKTSKETASSLIQLNTNQTDIKSKLDRQEAELEAEYTSLKQKIEKNVIAPLDTAEQNISRLTKSVDVVDSRLKQNLNLSDTVESLQSKIVDKVEPNLFNKEYFLVAFMLLFVLVLMTMIFLYRLYQRIEGAEPVQGGRSRNKPNRFQSSIDILRQVPSKPQLQAAVCIISFDEGRQAAHQQLLDSANLPNCRVVTFVVGRHANIPDLPRCKVYLMCTEFSERHVIIEEQGLGLGDLHRTTYDAVLKLGGQLIILYTRDPGSRRLKDDEVFNKNIYCVTHQEELVELNNLGRFFSVYDTLTAQQKTKLRKTIMDCLQ